MALSNELGNAGLTPESIRTTATVTLEKTAAGFAIPAVHLTLEAKVPGADRATFCAAGGYGKERVSRLQAAQGRHHTGCHTPVVRRAAARAAIAANLEDTVGRPRLWQVETRPGTRRRVPPLSGQTGVGIAGSRRGATRATSSTSRYRQGWTTRVKPSAASSRSRARASGRAHALRSAD